MTKQTNKEIIREQKLAQLQALSDYKLKLLGTKVDLKLPKAELIKMKKTYFAINKAIKQLSDELFGKVIIVKEKA